MPFSSGYFGLTGKMAPWNPQCCNRCNGHQARDPGRLEAPITAIDRGLKSRSTSASAPVTARSPVASVVLVMRYVQFHPEQPGVHDLAECIRTQRLCAAAVQAAVQHEVQRPDIRHLISPDRARHKRAEVLLDPLFSQVLAEYGESAVVVGDNAHVAYVALVAGAAVGQVKYPHQCS